MPAWAEAPALLIPTLTGPLAQFIATAKDAPWPEDILELAKRHLLDTLAAIIACHDLEPARRARAYALALSGEATPGMPIWGGPERAGLGDAVFANAMAGHAAEINDYSPSAFVQPGPSVVSVILALSQQRRRSGLDALKAMIAGYELACRIPKALGISNLRKAGLANHGIGPTFGCAAAAAVLLGLREDRMNDLFSLCCEQASGSWQWLLDTDHIEKAFVFAGMGAQRGLQTALMVEAGFTGVSDCLDRRGSWIDSGMFTGPGSDLNRAYLIEALGSRFELPLVGYKRFAAGGPTQAGMQGLLELVAKLDRSKISHVAIAMPSFDTSAFKDAAMPALNIPYMAALILIDGKLDFFQAQSRERMRTDPAVQAQMAKVELISDPSQDRKPRVESARVTVTLKDGSMESTFVDKVDGFPTAPLSHQAVENKAMELMAPRLGEMRARDIIQRVWTIDKAPRVDGLIKALAT